MANGFNELGGGDAITENDNYFSEDKLLAENVRNITFEFLKLNTNVSCTFSAEEFPVLKIGRTLRWNN